MNVSEILGCIIAVITIVTFLCGVLKWGIIDPLNKSINGLTISISKLEKLVDNLQNSEHSLDNRVSKIETIMKARGCDHLKNN